MADDTPATDGPHLTTTAANQPAPPFAHQPAGVGSYALSIGAYLVVAALGCERLWKALDGWARRRRADRKTDSETKAGKAFAASRVHAAALEDLVSALGADRAYLVRLHNCGGSVTSVAPKYSSVAHEEVRPGKPRMTSAWQSQEVDKAYIDTISQAWEASGRPIPIDRAKMPDGLLKDIWTSYGIASAVMFQVAAKEDDRPLRCFLGVAHFDQPSSSLGSADREAIRQARLAMRHAIESDPTA